MFAIVEIAGQQFRVKQNDKVYVHRLQGSAGDSISPKVLMVSNGGNITMNSGSVSATILSHLQGDKVITYHKKRRKGYAKKNGHRQALTQVQISSIA